MRKIQFGLVLGILAVLSAVTSLRASDNTAVASPADVKAADVKALTIFDIHFVGYSDGVHFVIRNGSKVVTGNYTGSDTVPIVGMKCKILRAGVNRPAIVFRSQYDRIHVVWLDTKQWTYYSQNGTVFNSGTWTYGFAGAGSADALEKLAASND